jgi:biotin transporter BioY
MTAIHRTIALFVISIDLLALLLIGWTLACDWTSGSDSWPFYRFMLLLAGAYYVLLLGWTWFAMRAGQLRCFSLTLISGLSLIPILLILFLASIGSAVA